MVRPANQPLYPWDVWLSMPTFSLLQGKHFDCQPHAMAQQIRNAALNRQKKVSIRIHAEGKLEVAVTDKVTA